MLTPRAVDYPRWYQDGVAKAELADNGPVRGTMMMRPYGFALWERMQRELDDRIKAAGARNVYFPLLIPESYLRREILNEVYDDFMREVLAIPAYVGAKTRRERFAGAVFTYTLEAMMGDGKALQIDTSHELGQNFASAFGTAFLDVDRREQHVWTTSWGASARMIGGLIMAHGDDDGLVVPPALAPIQVVVLLVWGEGGAGEVATNLAAELAAAGVRTELDQRTDTSFGRRATDWELKGVPVRIEVPAAGRRRSPGGRPRARPGGAGGPGLLSCYPDSLPR